MNKVLENYYKAQEEHDNALSALDKQVERIIKVLCKVFKKNRTDIWWAYDYYENDDPMPMPEKVTNDSFPVYIDSRMYTSIWEYSGGIPVKFFDMTDKEIEEYIKTEIAEDNAREEERKRKEQKRAEEKHLKDKTLKESALAKLTTEERKALGIK